ncbi:MAG: hypothetical protein GF364_14605 [Candidatus Lokiarchaeota archaeon]|nr:hypothetical protein [Candidatus Lokiarchaeota archaeon]
MENIDEEKRNNSKKVTGLEKYINSTSKFSKVVLNIALTFLAIVELVPILKSYEYAFFPDFITALVLWSALIVGIVVWSRLTYNNWLGQCINALAHVGAFFLINGMILKKEEAFPVFPMIQIFGWGLTGFMALSLLFNLINGLFLFPILRNQTNKNAKEWFNKCLTSIREKKRTVISALIITGLLGSAALVITQPAVWNTPIKIKPKNYTPELAFWASINTSLYTATQKDELNEHNIMIITYDTPRNITPPSTRTYFKNMIATWNNSYPNVKIMVAIPAPEGGFVWDGETPETIQLAKDYLNFFDEEHLDNVVGLSFDWEHPNNETRLEEECGINTLANESRNDESREQWHEFFNWADDNYPDMIMQNVNYVGSSVDILDGDRDITQRERYNIFDVPRWDEYAPMIYRGSCDGSDPYGDYPYWDPEDRPDPHYGFYVPLYLHSQAVEQVYGNTDRLGVYIGITNCTCYGRDVIQFQNGEEAGFGYDALVRDTLIAKHFGCPRITIFILNTVKDWDDEHESYHSMGGVFDTWGDSFLDEFNESINGPSSTDEFNIWYEPVIDGDTFTMSYYEFFVIDFLYNFSGLFGLVMFAVIIIFNILFEIYFQKKKRIGSSLHSRSSSSD